VNARAVLASRIEFEAPARRVRLALADAAAVAAVGEGPARVLDAGCGDGLGTLTLARRHPGWEVVGADLRDDLLEGGRARARAQRLENVQFVHADLTEPLPVDGFDVVLAIECLTEIPDDGAALSAMAGALKPGGTLVVHVPERSWTPVLPGSDPTWRDEVRHGYTEDELAAALARVGVEPVEIRPTFRATAVAAQELRDRVKHAPLLLRAAAFPAFAAAAALERRGVTGGRPRALLAVGRRA
jgi:SAM-dependent methyltransferase